MNRITNKTYRLFGQFSVCLVLLILSMVGAMAQRGVSPLPPKVSPVLARLNTNISIADILRDYGGLVLERIPDSQLYSLAPPRGQTPDQYAEQLELDPLHPDGAGPNPDRPLAQRRILYAETDKPVMTPETEAIRSGQPKQMPLSFDGGNNPGRYMGQDAYYQVRMAEAQVYAKGYGVIVAVLDTGVNFSHPALQGRLLPGYNAIAPGAAPADIPDGRGNYAVGHGTMVAGIIAQVAPGAQILPIRVLNGDGSGSMLNVAKGIHYAITHGARILNMSFGTTNDSSTLSDFLDEAEHEFDALLVASAGNLGIEQRQYPAHGHGAIAVASIEENFRKSPFSNYGNDIRVCAPGSNIWSTFWDGGYASWSGTSFAAPFVAGQAALLFSLNLAFTADDVKDFIEDSARDIDRLNPQLDEGDLGKGAIDMYASVQRALRSL
jgi:subtilisin family serine protease